MILTCPACATRYVIGDDVFRAGEREVRCARCGHRWTTDGSDAVDEVDARMQLQNEAPAPVRESRTESPPEPPAADQVGFGLNDLPGMDRAAQEDDEDDDPVADDPRPAPEPLAAEPEPPARKARPRQRKPMAEPDEPRGRRRTPVWVWLGWVVLLACIGGLAAALVLMRGPLVEAWPPLQRLYDTVGSATGDATGTAQKAPAVALAVESSELQQGEGGRQLNLLIRLTNTTEEKQPLPIAVVHLLREDGETEKTERIRLPADQPLAAKESRVMALRLSDVPAAVTGVRAESEAGAGH